MPSQSKREVKVYLKKAQNRIHSAKLLLEGGEYNDAISRCYYAFFDAARAALLSKDLTAKTHHGVVVLFDKHFIKNKILPVKFGRWLAKVKEAREEADYEIYKEFSKKEVQTTIKAAREFVDTIENLVKNE